MALLPPSHLASSLRRDLTSTTAATTGKKLVRPSVRSAGFALVTLPRQGDRTAFAFVHARAASPRRDARERWRPQRRFGTPGAAVLRRCNRSSTRITTLRALKAFRSSRLRFRASLGRVVSASSAISPILYLDGPRSDCFLHRWAPLHLPAIALPPPGDPLSPASARPSQVTAHARYSRYTTTTTMPGPASTPELAKVSSKEQEVFAEHDERTLETGGTADRKRLERKLLWKLDARFCL